MERCTPEVKFSEREAWLLRLVDKPRALMLLVADATVTLCHCKNSPYEFHPATQVPAPAPIEFEPPPDFSRAHAAVPRASGRMTGRSHCAC